MNFLPGLASDHDRPDLQVAGIIGMSHYTQPKICNKVYRKQILQKVLH
jgi:hypothetical protein